MPGAIKDVQDYKYALVYYSQSDGRTEVELFRSSESREARLSFLASAKIKAEYAHVNQTT